MRSVVFVAVLLLVALSVSAVDFSVSVFPSERTIKSNETAQFEVELSHNSPVEETFEVFSNDVTWDIRPEESLKVPAAKTVKANILVRPLNLNPGAYNLPVVFKRVGSNDQQKQMLYIEVASPFPDDATYLPAVRGLATVEPNIDPRKGMTIKLSLENQNRRILDKVDVKVRSAVLNKDYTTNLGPLEKKTLTFIAELDPSTPPQKDNLQISVIVPEKDKAYQFDLFPVPFEVIAYGSVVPHNAPVTSFLKTTDTVTLINEGNKKVTYVYRVPAWFGRRAFISGTPEGVVDSGDVTWEVTLAGGEQAPIIVVYNYRPLFWLFLIALIVTIAYYYFRSPIAVYKRAVVLKTLEGGITEVKVIVELVNRGSKTARAVKIMDLTPRLTDVEKEFKETILAPSKIVPHEQTGTLVRWDLDMMEAKEHRILMYRMRTRLQVLGGMTLPVTAVHYLVEGQEREAVSNKAELRYKS